MEQWYNVCVNTCILLLCSVAPVAQWVASMGSAPCWALGYSGVLYCLTITEILQVLALHSLRWYPVMYSHTLWSPYQNSIFLQLLGSMMITYYDIGLVMIYIESSSSGCTVGIAGT